MGARRLRTRRPARISEAQAFDFWERITEFERLPRSGETVYGFAVGVYPTDIRRSVRAATSADQVAVRPGSSS